MARHPTRRAACTTLPHFSSALYFAAVQSPREYITLYTQVFHYADNITRSATCSILEAAKQCERSIEREAEEVFVSHLPLEWRCIYRQLGAREKQMVRTLSQSHAAAAQAEQTYRRIARHIFKPLLEHRSWLAEQERLRNQAAHEASKIQKKPQNVAPVETS